MKIKENKKINFSEEEILKTAKNAYKEKDMKYIEKAMKVLAKK